MQQQSLEQTVRELRTRIDRLRQELDYPRVTTTNKTLTQEPKQDKFAALKAKLKP